MPLSDSILLQWSKKLGRYFGQHFNLRFFIVLISYLICTNLVFWFLGYSINADRYWIVLDYLWILPLFFFQYKYTQILFFLLFISIYFIDVLYWIRQFFPFITLQDFTNFLTYLPFAPKIYWYFLGFGFVYLILLIFMLRKLSKLAIPQMLLPYLLLYTVFYGLVFDYRGVNYSDHLKTQGYWGSMYETYANLKFNRNLHWQQAKTPQFSPASFPSVLQSVIDVRQPPNKIVFILNESWGISAIDKHLNDDVIQAVVKHPKVDVIATGESPAGNGTIMAEIREMCALTSDSPNFKLADLQQFDNCLPRQLRRQGYVNHSFHGAEAGMYARDEWYSGIGFSHPKFYPNFDRLERCSSFPGACDKNILLEVAKQNQNDQHKSFIYWLTLNSHHPYSEKDIEQWTFDCQSPRFNQRQEVCRNLNLQAQFFNHLAEKIQQGDFKETTFVVVGDHVPPLVSDRDKQSFKADRVPFIVFKVD